MRRNPVPLLLTVFAVVYLAVLAAVVLHGGVPKRLLKVAKIQNTPSALYLRLTIRYDKPPIYEEVYDMKDVNGVSTATYKVVGYSGKVISIIEPPGKTYDVSFFFGKIVQDGIWQLTNRPPRGNTSVHYTLFIKQYADNKHGSRTIVFTDPHYWAVTAGRQYQIRLDPNKPVPDLLKLDSTSIADPRYQEIVDDFRAFGSPAFRRKVEEARAAIRNGR